MSTVSLSLLLPLCKNQTKKNKQIWDLCLISRLERRIDIKMIYKCQTQAVSVIVVVLVEDVEPFRVAKCYSIVPDLRCERYQMESTNLEQTLHPEDKRLDVYSQLKKKNLSRTLECRSSSVGFSLVP